MNPTFLSFDEVLALQAEQISLFGGLHGVRDLGLLQSALGMAEATFGDAYLHGTLHEMAAAYLFHLVKNHPFLDGNKRIGLKVALVFLRLNQVRVAADEDSLVALVVGVADGTVTKAQVGVYLELHAIDILR